MKIKNWKKFQHYKNRKPPWIKLHRDLLDDDEAFDMRGDDFRHLVMLWIIASEDEEKDGNLPAIKSLAFRLRISHKKTRELLNRLNHWIIQDASEVLADCKQSAIAETETEERQNRDRVEGEPPPQKRNTTLPETWQPNEKHLLLASESGIDINWELDKFRDYAAANNWKKADWDATFRNWLRKAGEYKGGGASKGGIAAWGRILKRMEENQDTVNPTVLTTKEKQAMKQSFGTLYDLRHTDARFMDKNRDAFIRAFEGL